jgi:hypothetical protein
LGHSVVVERVRSMVIINLWSTLVVTMFYSGWDYGLHWIWLWSTFVSRIRTKFGISLDLKRTCLHLTNLELVIFQFPMIWTCINSFLWTFSK